MKKRGIGDIISTVLVILIVIIGVSIVSFAPLNFIRNSSETIEVEANAAVLVISSPIRVSVSNINNNINFDVTRYIGGRNIVGVDVLIYADESFAVKQTIYFNPPIGEQETRNVRFLVSVGENSKLTKVSIVPIVKSSSGKEFPVRETSSSTNMIYS